MLDSQFVTFFVVAGMLTMTPGPGTMLVVRNALHGGCHDGIVTACGIGLAFLVHGLLSVLGVSAILLHSAIAFDLVKLIGVGYMAWMGVRSLWRAVRGATAPSDPVASVTPETVGKPRYWLESFLISVLNPKSALFALIFLPQFIGPTDPVFETSMFLTGIRIVQCMLWLVIVSVGVDQARRFFLHTRFRRWLDGGSGALLLGFGARLALATR